MASEKQGTEKDSVLSDKDKFEGEGKEKLGQMGEKTQQGQSSKSSGQTGKK